MKPYALGMDIGGTNTVCGVVDKDGKVICTDSIKTQKYPILEDYIAALTEMINGLCEKVGGKDKVQGLGVGAPNGNYYNGNIELAPNLPWKGIVIPFAKMVSEAIGLPVRLTNDANAAALGEMAYGVAKGMKHFIMITLGTGVGSGIVIDGKMVYGHDGFAGELGHTIVRQDGRLCGCGRKGCLEAYCSATGIARTAREYVETTEIPSLLREIKAEDITSKDIYDAAVKGDELAIQIFRETGTILGKALANFVVFSSPEAIVLFGGLAKAGDFIMKYTKEALEANSLAIFKGKTQLLLSGLKDADAAVLGASALGWEEE
ncbi:MAG: ROK family protein [Bacteroidales bacterium]|nr:ROK family protein [Candidatus Liminaster caballi]